MIDISNVDKEARQFGIFTITEMDGIPFMSYVDEENDEYVLYENAFINFDELFSDASNLNHIKRDMTFEEASEELSRLTQEFFDKHEEDNEGDQYHTVSIDPNDNTDVDMNKTYNDYEKTLLINKSNFYINFDNLTKKDLEPLMEARKQIFNMANDWYIGVADVLEIVEDLKRFFGSSNINIDLSEYDAENICEPYAGC